MIHSDLPFEPHMEWRFRLYQVEPERSIWHEKNFFSPLKKFRWFRCSMRFEVIGYISHLICRLSSYASGLQCCFILLSQLSIHLSVNFSKYLMLRSLYLFYWLYFGVDWDKLHFAWVFFFNFVVVSIFFLRLLRLLFIYWIFSMRSGKLLNSTARIDLIDSLLSVGWRKFSVFIHP